MCSLKSKLRPFHKRLKFWVAINLKPIIRIFYKCFYKPKEGSLSAVLDKFSKNTKPFYVVQIGANDGLINDPIFKFIQRDNWKGVLLEPLQHVYLNYLSKLYKRSKNIKTINAALDQQDGTKNLYKLSFTNARWATGLSSFVKSSLIEAIESGYVAEKAKKEGIELPKNKENFFTIEKVNCISPETLLQSNKIEKINLLMIDTEGYDFEVIKMFDIANTQPDMIVFEHVNLSEEEKNTCHEHLGQCGYIFKSYGVNTVAINKQLEDLFNS